MIDIYKSMIDIYNMFYISELRGLDGTMNSENSFFERNSFQFCDLRVVNLMVVDVLVSYKYHILSNVFAG